jgi:hypothetical protein
MVVFAAVSETESETFAALLLYAEEVARLSLSLHMSRNYACAHGVQVLSAWIVTTTDSALS